MASHASPLKLVPPLQPAPHESPVESPLFSKYGLDAAYDEMFDAGRRARPHYRPLIEELQVASTEELHQRQLEADRAFLTQGITFTVYGDDQGTERIFPFDLLPRILTGREWETLERGLAQRLTRFLRHLPGLEAGVLARGLPSSRRSRASVRPR